MYQQISKIVAVGYIFSMAIIVSPNLQAATVSGTVSGFQSINRIRCINRTSRQSVTVPASLSGTWDCEQAGLIVNTGDNVEVRVQITAQGSIPDRPDQISALGAQNYVLLQWGQTDKADIYSIYRSTQPDTAPSITNKVADTGSSYFFDHAVTPGITYYYSLTASNTAGESQPGGPVAGATNSAGLDHSIVTPFTCRDCHNGITGPQEPSGHFYTTLNCDTCHSTATWIPVNYTHRSGNYPGDHNPRVVCAMCHAKNDETIAYVAPSLAPSCAGCHAPNYRSSIHNGRPLTTNSNCGQSGCHRVSDRLW